VCLAIVRFSWSRAEKGLRNHCLPAPSLAALVLARSGLHSIVHHLLHPRLTSARLPLDDTLPHGHNLLLQLVCMHPLGPISRTLRRLVAQQDNTTHCDAGDEAALQSFWSGWAIFGGLGDGGEERWLDEPKIEIGDPLGHADVRIVRRAHSTRGSGLWLHSCEAAPCVTVEEAGAPWMRWRARRRYMLPVFLQIR